jgi:hypothetical protein
MPASIKPPPVGKSGFDWKETGGAESKLLDCGQAMHAELIQLLRRRESVIADHAWRDRDAAGHLEALKNVSEEISAWAAAHSQVIDARLRHYLSNASYSKALVHLEAQAGD